MSAMGDHTPDASERPRRSAIVSPSEKLMCEWEARHDVAARGRQVDPAAALHRYLTHTRIEEDLRHRDNSAAPVPARPAPPRDTFASQHPLVASWLRWGDEPR